MTPDRPIISVIIPTHDRSASLWRTLVALGRQTFPCDAVEVVVIADGCRDDTVAMLRGRPTPFSLRVLEQPGLGAAAARNCGAAEARAQILLFLDDDVEPEPGLLEAHVRVHQQAAARVGLGPYPPAFEGPGDFLRIMLRHWWGGLFRAMAEPGHRFTYRDLVSGNLSLEADLLSRIGGFDPTIPGCGGEDWELGIRLIQAGATFQFVPEALARHHEHETTDLDRYFQRARKEGRADVHMVFRHPRLDPVLPAVGSNPVYQAVHGALRFIAFHWPATGDVVAAGLRWMLDVLEWARFRRRWRLLCAAVRAYWYWRGVAEELRLRESSLGAFLEQGGIDGREAAPELEIDLRHGLAAAERLLDQLRPAALRIRYGPCIVGRVPAEPHAERLRGDHLRPLLASRMATQLLVAIATDRVLPDGSRHDEAAALTLRSQMSSGVDVAPIEVSPRLARGSSQPISAAG